jgi:hypothetical protein
MPVEDCYQTQQSVASACSGRFHHLPLILISGRSRQTGQTPHQTCQMITLEIETLANMVAMVTILTMGLDSVSACYFIAEPGYFPTWRQCCPI